MRKALAAVLIAALLGGSVCAGMWLVDFFDQKQEQKVKIIHFRKLAVTPLETDLGQPPIPSPAQESQPQEQEEPTSLHNFSALQAENPDCVGWVSIPDTPIDFPVMQSKEEPEFYLKHDFDREYDIYGLPFLDARCSLDSGNLLVYGHHMNDGSMFSCLHKYADKAYQKEHLEILFETPEGAETYRVAAVLRVKGSYKPDEWSIFQSVEPDSQTVEQIAAGQLYNTDIEILPGDKLLTLVTCEYSQQNGRLAVIAVKE